MTMKVAGVKLRPPLQGKFRFLFSVALVFKRLEFCRKTFISSCACFYFALGRWLLLQTRASLLIQIAEDHLPRVGKRFGQTELQELLPTGAKHLPFAATRGVFRVGYTSEWITNPWIFFYFLTLRLERWLSS